MSSGAPQAVLGTDRPPPSCDIVVLGAGYVGCLAALVLSRKGYSVVLVERGPQPRFSLGESTTPEQNRVHLQFARAFGIPELAPLASYPRLKRSQAPIAIWPKETFYFLLNDADPGAGPREVAMQSAPWPVGPDYHCTRAEYDLYLLTLARKYGAHYLGMAEVCEVDVTDTVWCKINTATGPLELQARFIVDASGPNSVLARAIGVGLEDPDPTSLRSRAVFSHFVNVRRLEDLYGRRWKPMGIPRDNGTVHCVWDAGWAWVIPFESGVTSVGVTLNSDRDHLDHDNVGAAEAFWTVAREQTYLSALLDGASSIRPYERTGPIQRRARRTVGDNWVMLPPAAGLADALLSPGNAVAANAVGRLAWAIDGIMREGRPGSEALEFMQRRFSVEFIYVRRLQQILFESFYDLDVFRECFVLFPTAVKLGVATRPEPDQAPTFQVVWGFGNRAMRDLTDEVRAVLLAGRRAGADPAGLAAAVRETVRRSDPTRFARYFALAKAAPAVHLNRVLPLLRWAHGLRSSRDADIAAASRHALRHILGQAWAAISSRQSGGGSLTPLIVRQMWLQWSGHVGGKILAALRPRRALHGRGEGRLGRSTSRLRKAG